MKKVLFLPTHETSWCEMLLLAMELKDKTEVCFLIDTPLMLGNIASLESKRIKYFVTTDESLDNNASVKLPFVYGLKKLLKKISIITKLIKWIRYKYLTSNKFIKKEYSDTYTKFDSKLVLLRKLFDVEAFDVCVVYGDRHISCCELPLLAVCRERKIPAIIPPISLAAVGETLTHNMTQRYQVRRFPEIFNKFPNQIWMNPKTGESFFFYPVGIMLALSELKILPDNPWALGGSASTNILVDGEYDKQRLVKSGCPIDKIIITGHRSHDKMLSLLINKETLKGDLVTKYSFDVKKKLLVIVLPQWVEDCLLERVFAWDEINRLCEALSNPAWSTLVSLHPKMVRNDYLFLEEKYSLKIAKERLDEIIPIADLFVSSFSSTVRWAALCGVPALVLDFHGEKFELFNEMNGVIIIEERKKLKRLVETLFENEEKYSEYVVHQKEMSTLISPFDGRCCERILMSILSANIE